MTYAIIAVGYNRASEMKRLLLSICEAEVNNIQADLIISLDFSDKQKELIEVAEHCKWKYGKKIIRAYSERQGLRKHILQCGDLTSKYDAVVVLEDDLVVAKGFMQYVDSVCEMYRSNDKIAGISLYTHRTNPGNGRFFEAQFNGYDVFFMQYAQSWGQCWTRQMWEKFRKWYNNHDGDIQIDWKMPKYIEKWNKQSWLKYYIRYTIDFELFHIYPYHSLSTNGSSIGEHNNSYSSAYQVPLQQGIITRYRLPSLDDAVKYDAFFERIIDKSFEIRENGKVILDLYGLRTEYGDNSILYSVKSLPYKMVRQIQLQYRPIEVNCLLQEPGEGIFVYDLKTSFKAPRNRDEKIMEYELRAQSSKRVFRYEIRCLLKRLVAKVKR